MGKFDDFKDIGVAQSVTKPMVNIAKSNNRTKFSISEGKNTPNKILKIKEALNLRNRNDVYDIVIEDYARQRGVDLSVPDAVYIEAPLNGKKIKTSMSIDLLKLDKLKKIKEKMNIRNTSLTVDWLVDSYRNDYGQEG